MLEYTRTNLSKFIPVPFQLASVIKNAFQDLKIHLIWPRIFVTLTIKVGGNSIVFLSEHIDASIFIS
jgi:hypothetical protein